MSAARLLGLSSASRRLAGLVLVLASSLPAALPAQASRQLLAQGHQAYELAEFDRAAALLPLGLNPATGPRDTLWTRGVLRLAEVLMDAGREPVAQTWLRWGLRLAPDMLASDVEFPPAVIRAFNSAGEFVRTTTADPTVVSTSWQWPTVETAQGAGALLIRGGDVQVNGRIEGGEFLVAGSPKSLAAGSYTILATAEGYLPTRTTVEVLPGVTTELSFRLAPASPGFLYVASRPWGTVYLDGERIGYTALAARRLVPGTHRLRIEREAYLPFDTTFTVAQNQRLRLGTIELRVRNR